CVCEYLTITNKTARVAISLPWHGLCHSGVVMEFFDIRKMPVSLWRNGAGETREICCIPPATRDFCWRASIATIASNGEFSAFPGVDRVITLLEGGEVTLDAGQAFCHTLKHHQPFCFSGD